MRKRICCNSVVISWFVLWVHPVHTFWDVDGDQKIDRYSAHWPKLFLLNNLMYELDAKCFNNGLAATSNITRQQWNPDAVGVWIALVQLNACYFFCLHWTTMEFSPSHFFFPDLFCFHWTWTSSRIACHQYTFIPWIEESDRQWTLAFRHQIKWIGTS